VAGRFSCLHGRKIPGFGAWGECQQDRQEAYPHRLFKQAVNLSKQARAIEATLDGITPLNAEKKKEEALAMLKK